jgi:glycosyltransferase involved in cell wall biosynthesis
MKVLVATHSYAGNGAAVMLLAVIKHWVQTLGWTVDVLLDLDAEVPDDLAQTGACAFNSADPKSYDFALVNTIISAHYVDKLAPLVRTVLWVHEGETVLMNSPTPVDKWQHLFRLPWKNVFQTTWQSETVFKTFLLKTPPERIACVRNGLPPLPEKLTPAVKPAGMKRIVFVGGVYGRKRPNDLVDAVLALGRDDVECVFVGPVDAIETIGREHVQKIHAHPMRFKLAGQLDRVRALEMLASADVFCLPSGDESQPIAPLEAAALGIPCVLTDLDPYRGIWRHGVNCLQNPVGDRTLLLWNLRALIEDNDLRQGIARGAGSLLDQFSVSAFLNRFTGEMPS